MAGGNGKAKRAMRMRKDSGQKAKKRRQRLTHDPAAPFRPASAQSTNRTSAR